MNKNGPLALLFNALVRELTIYLAPTKTKDIARVG